MWIDDEVLSQHDRPVALRCWVPVRPLVVLGSSNDSARELYLERCEEEGVEVLKRYGGGGAVLLHPGCVVLGLGLWVRHHHQNRRYFDLINRCVIKCLSDKWPALAGIGQAGLGDLVVGNRKIAGTSMFRSRNYLLYQASLLVDARIDQIERLLRHPSREPDYRAGRTHRDFLAGIAQLAGGVTPADCCSELTSALLATLGAVVAEELVAPHPEQFASLAARLARAGRPVGSNGPDPCA